uniref:Exonuclease domain-containing protein n=1 Tax=Rhabditophanes sp. KR3021 TaxID=114890 RepID=A0AC35THS6_9BILA
MAISKKNSLFPKNVTADYFKARIEGYKRHVLAPGALSKFASTLIPIVRYNIYEHGYDYPRYLRYWNNTTPAPEGSAIRNPIVFKSNPPCPAFEDKNLEGSVCMNCGQIYKLDRKLEKKGIKQKCIAKDGSGNIIKEHKEHKTICIPDKERYTFMETPVKNESKVKNELVAIHCDIVYTTAGVVVASCYIVDNNFNLILDENVKIDNRIVDAHHPLNNYLKTKRIVKDGITVEQLRDKIFELIDKSTILVGFDLAPILRTLRIVHDTFLDLAYHQQFAECKDSLFNYLKHLAQKSENIVSKSDSLKKSTELMATAYMTVLSFIYLDAEHGRDDSILMKLNAKESAIDETSENDSDNDFEEFEFDEICHIYDKYRKPLIVNNYKKRPATKTVKKESNNLELNFVLPPKDASNEEEVKVDTQKYIEIKRNIPRKALWKAHDMSDLSESDYDEDDDYEEENVDNDSIKHQHTMSRLYNALYAKIPTSDLDKIKCGFPVWSDIKSNGKFVLANTFSRYRGKAFIGANQTNVECAKCNKSYEIDSDFNQVDTDSTCNTTTEESDFEQLCVPHYMKTMPYETRSTFESSPVSDSQSINNVLIVNSSIVYTTHGPEIAKLSVLRVSKTKLIYTLIKVENKIIEYDFENTNLTNEDMSTAAIDKEEARSKLFGLIADKTILIGHNLALTLRCLRIVHENVVELHWLQSNCPIKKQYAMVPFNSLCKTSAAENNKDDLLLYRSFATSYLIFDFLDTKKESKKQQRAEIVNTAEYDNELRDCMRIEQNAYKRFQWG